MKIEVPHGVGQHGEEEERECRGNPLATSETGSGWPQKNGKPEKTSKCEEELCLGSSINNAGKFWDCSNAKKIMMPWNPLDPASMCDQQADYPWTKNILWTFVLLRDTQTDLIVFF